VHNPALGELYYTLLILPTLFEVPHPKFPHLSVVPASLLFLRSVLEASPRNLPFRLSSFPSSASAVCQPDFLFLPYCLICYDPSFLLAIALLEVQSFSEPLSFSFFFKLVHPSPSFPAFHTRKPFVRSSSFPLENHYRLSAKLCLLLLSLLSLKVLEYFFGFFPPP